MTDLPPTVALGDTPVRFHLDTDRPPVYFDRLTPSRYVVDISPTPTFTKEEVDQFVREAVRDCRRHLKENP